jgi:hypothetical protein
MGNNQAQKNCTSHKTPIRLAALLLVTVFPQTFFPFVGRHFMTFSFFSAWHELSVLMVVFKTSEKIFQIDFQFGIRFF